MKAVEALHFFSVTTKLFRDHASSKTRVRAPRTDAFVEIFKRIISTIVRSFCARLALSTRARGNKKIAIAGLCKSRPWSSPPGSAPRHSSSLGRGEEFGEETGVGKEQRFTNRVRFAVHQQSTKREDHDTSSRRVTNILASHWTTITDG